MKEVQEVINRDTEIVSRVRAELAAELGDDRFELWFEAGTRLDWTAEGLRVIADSDFRLERLRKGMLAEIQRAVAAVVGPDVAVSFQVDANWSQHETATPQAVAATSTQDHRTDCEEQSGTAVPRVITEPAAATVSASAPIRSTPAAAATVAGPWKRNQERGRRFASLGTLVRGECNELALSAADMVLRNPGSMNPFFVHGPSGSGKTHLLEGIWSEVRRLGGRRVIYLSAEQFTTYFLQALRGSGLPSFRQKYRAVDLLILDDIQFFAGKQATVNELLHTLDALLRESRQIVLASDRPAAELASLAQELPARISGGIVCQLQPLDATTKQRLLQQLAQQRGVPLSDPLAERIADRCCGDARQLVGFMNRLWTTCQATAVKPHEPLVDQLLDELFPQRGGVVRLDDIQRVICDEFGINWEQLKSDGRSRKISQPRMLAMWLARKHTRAALTEIGEYFGRRSHSTVVSAQQKVDQWVRQGERLLCDHEESDVRAVVSRLEQSLRA